MNNQTNNPANQTVSIEVEVLKELLVQIGSVYICSNYLKRYKGTEHEHISIQDLDNTIGKLQNLGVELAIKVL